MKNSSSTSKSINSRQEDEMYNYVMKAITAVKEKNIEMSVGEIILLSDSVKACQELLHGKKVANYSNLLSRLKKFLKKLNAKK